MEINQNTYYWLALDLKEHAYNVACNSTLIQPRNGNAWLERAIVELRCGWREASRHSLLNATKFDSSLMEAWALYSKIAVIQKEYKAALESSHRVLCSRPDLGPLIGRTAMALSNHNALFEALDLIDHLQLLGYEPRFLQKEHVRILGVLGFQKDALYSLQRLWQTSKDLTL